jgi:hypothetical protein
VCLHHHHRHRRNLHYHRHHPRRRLGHHHQTLFVLAIDDDDDDEGTLDSVSSPTYISLQVNMALHSEEEEMQIWHSLVFHFPDLDTNYHIADSKTKHRGTRTPYKPGVN